MLVLPSALEALVTMTVWLAPPASARRWSSSICSVLKASRTDHAKRSLEAWRPLRPVVGTRSTIGIGASASSSPESRTRRSKRSMSSAAIEPRVKPAIAARSSTSGAGAPVAARGVSAAWERMSVGSPR